MGSSLIVFLFYFLKGCDHMKHVSFEDLLNQKGSVKFIQHYYKNPSEPEILTWIESNCNLLVKKCKKSEHEALINAVFQLLKYYCKIDRKKATVSDDIASLMNGFYEAGVKGTIIDNQLRKHYDGLAVLNSKKFVFTINRASYFPSFYEHNQDKNVLQACFNFCDIYAVDFDSIAEQCPNLIILDSNHLCDFEPEEYVKRIYQSGGTMSYLAEHFKFDAKNRKSFLVLYYIMRQNQKDNHCVDYEQLLRVYEELPDEEKKFGWFFMFEFKIFTQKYRKESEKKNPTN